MKKKDEAENPSEYEVGYGKPPKQHRFKEGKSGNPKGRPKKPTTFLSALEKEAGKKIAVRQGDKVVKVTKMEAVAMNSMTVALKGDKAMIKMLMLLLSQSEKANDLSTENEADDFTIDDEAVQRIMHRYYRPPVEDGE